jgi:hypothetical protein
MPKGVNQGAEPDVISPKPVWGQFRVARPQIHIHWSAFGASSFLDDKQPVHGKACCRQLRANFRIARDWTALYSVLETAVDFTGRD